MKYVKAMWEPFKVWWGYMWCALIHHNDKIWSSDTNSHTFFCCECHRRGKVPN